jgi:hypothetical protein
MLNVSTVLEQSPWSTVDSLRKGRCWIFPADRDVTSQFAQMASILDPFLKQWTAHGSLVEAEAALISGFFLVIAEGQAGEASSGCSQDALRAVITRLEGILGTTLLAGGRMYWRDSENTIHCLDRAAFRAASEAGTITDETWVFDTMVQNVADLEIGRFIKPVRESWHNRLLVRVNA